MVKIYVMQKADLPEPTGTNTPVCRNICQDSCLPIPRSAFLSFPFVACTDIPGGTRHLFAPLPQPIPREEGCAGQMVHVEISLGEKKTDARAKISSTSDCTSFTPTLLMCLEISLSQDTKGTTTSRLYLLSDEQIPPIRFLKEQVASIFWLLLRL